MAACSAPLTSCTASDIRGGARQRSDPLGRWVNLLTEKQLTALLDRTTKLFFKLSVVRKIVHIHMDVEVNIRFGSGVSNTLLACHINDVTALR